MPPVSPDQLDAIQLSIALTAAGATVFGAFIVGIIGLLKKLGRFGAWIENGNEPVVAYVLAAIVVISAYSESLMLTAAPVTPQGILIVVFSWYNIAKIATAIHGDVTTVRNRGS